MSWKMTIMEQQSARDSTCSVHQQFEIKDTSALHKGETAKRSP